MEICLSGFKFQYVHPRMFRFIKNRNNDTAVIHLKKKKKKKYEHQDFIASVIKASLAFS